MSNPGVGDRKGKILIGFAEALATPEVAWSLLDAGFELCVFTRKDKRPPISRCRGIEAVPLISPEADALASAEELAALISDRGFSMVMPLDDKSIWVCDRAARRTQVRVAGPTGRLADLALDKRLQLELASVCGLSVPHTGYVNTVDELLRVNSLPVILKPALAVNVERQQLIKYSKRLCGSREELETYARQWNGSYPLLVQPVLRGVGEGLFGIATSRGVVNWSAHRRIRMMNPTGSGSSACQGAAIDDTLVGPATAMMETSGWTGLFMLEMLRDDEGRAWFIELNGRAWGSMALSRRRGLEYPAWAVRQVMDADDRIPEVVPGDDRIVCRHLGREIVHLLMVLHGPTSNPWIDWPSRWRTCRDVLRIRRGGCWYNWRRGQTLFFIRDTLQTVGEAVARRARTQ